MLRVGYVFERFPAFGQTFCYREVAELLRQGVDVQAFSIRRPNEQLLEGGNEPIAGRVLYLPEEAALVKEIDAARDLPPKAKQAIKNWGRNTDFLRLYQAAWIGQHLRAAGIRRVHAHFAGMAARTAWWLREFFEIDYSFTAHANDIFTPREFEISIRHLFEGATAIVTVSDFAVAHLRQRFPFAATKIQRVYNGIAVEQFSRAKSDDSIPLILSVGRLIEKKGFADLINACARLQASGVEFRCEITGEGPLEASLREQIAAAGLGDLVALTGPLAQPELRGRYAAATLFALACKPTADGDMDNLPTVIMEAMAAGLPVVSTKLAGIPEMVQPGTTGELVDPGDVAALADALKTLISNPSASRMGECGRELAERRFSIATTVAELRRILGERF